MTNQNKKLSDGPFKVLGAISVEHEYVAAKNRHVGHGI